MQKILIIIFSFTSVLAWTLCGWLYFSQDSSVVSSLHSEDVVPSFQYSTKVDFEKIVDNIQHARKNYVKVNNAPNEQGLTKAFADTLTDNGTISIDALLATLENKSN